MRTLTLSLIILATTACTSFTAEALRPDGTVAGRVHERGAPFISRESVWEIEYEWLDEKTNTLNRLSVKRNTAENAEAQAELADMLARIGAKGALGL